MKSWWTALPRLATSGAKAAVVCDAPLADLGLAPVFGHSGTPAGRQRPPTSKPPPRRAERDGGCGANASAVRPNCACPWWRRSSCTAKASAYGIARAVPSGWLYRPRVLRRLAAPSSALLQAVGARIAVRRSSNIPYNARGAPWRFGQRRSHRGRPGPWRGGNPCAGACGAVAVGGAEISERYWKPPCAS